MKQVALRLDEGLLERVDGARGSLSRQAWMVGAFRLVLAGPALGGPVEPSKVVSGFVESSGASQAPAKAKSSPRTAAAGFKGSELPGNADVPELGWFRPTSAEAKRGVEVDVKLLERALGKR